MSARVLAVHAGRVAELPWPGRDPGRTIASGIVKHPLLGRVRVGELGIDGDEHGDTRNHGGPEKALCIFASEHYPHFERLLGRPLARPAFGENLTTAGVGEGDVCIGDVLQVGSVLGEVSLPRNPCFRVGARHGAKRFPLWMEEGGRTGFYLRILRPGRLAAGAALELLRRPHPHATIAECNRVMHRDRDDRAAIAALLVPALAPTWRTTFERRLAGEFRDESRRRFGPVSA